jgi:GDSL-like Lipase/Acylhydrolase family
MHLARRIGLNTLLVVMSVALFFVGLEVFIRVSDSRVNAKPSAPTLPAPAVVPDRFADVPAELLARAAARFSFLTMPEEWQHRDVQVPGAARAYYWQGALHILNADQMRHPGPYPTHRPGVFRIAIFGDSLTYGQGIAEEDTFAHLLNDWLSGGGKLEVLNLGVPGAQSEDIVLLMKRFIPLLQPDLVVYTVCLNDFLPTGVGQYQYYYAFPLPNSWKTFLIDHSRAAQFTSDLYDATLRRLHLRRDFYDDILADFNSYQTRFRNDVAHMQAIAEAAGIKPIVSMVVDQFPDYGGRGYAIAKLAEHIMMAQGFDVIPTEDFYWRYHAAGFAVSPWEGHPNEVANYIWARMLSAHLRSRLPDLLAGARDLKTTSQ